MRQLGVAVQLAAVTREAATETEHKKFLPSLRDSRDCSFVFRGLTPTATCCTASQFKDAQLQI